MKLRHGDGVFVYEGRKFSDKKDNNNHYGSNVN